MKYGRRCEKRKVEAEGRGDDLAACLPTIASARRMRNMAVESTDRGSKVG